jgi:hypothetical protein
MTNRTLVAAVFLVGCAVGGVSGQLVVPKASAQQAAALTKWEYTYLRWETEDGLLTWQGLKDTTNRLGGERWEMVGDTEGFIWFKRPKM